MPVLKKGERMSTTQDIELWMKQASEVTKQENERETKEEFIREIRELLNANEKVVHVELNQIVDMVHEVAESWRY
jgi:mevalonate kinase